MRARAAWPDSWWPPTSSWPRAPTPSRRRPQAERVAREKLAPYQVPRSINVVAEIARNEVFKILRRETQK